MNDARKVAPGIEPGLPESESGVITITLRNQRTLHIESYKYIEYNKFSEVHIGLWRLECIMPGCRISRFTLKPYLISILPQCRFSTFQTDLHYMDGKAIAT